MQSGNGDMYASHASRAKHVTVVTAQHDLVSLQIKVDYVLRHVSCMQKV
jgi:hypothetical protein